MSSWLTDLTTACGTQLQDMGKTLNTMKDRYMYWNDDYYQKAQNLVSERQYQGEGATAFLQAVDTDINMFRPIYDGLGHAGSACANLQGAIEASSAKYDNAMASLSPLTPPYYARWELPRSVFNNWREQLIQRTLADTGNGATDILNGVLENGNIYLYSGAYQAVEWIAQQDAEEEIQRWLATDMSIHLPAYLNPQLNPDVAKNPDLAQQSALMQNTILQSIEQTKHEIRTYYQAAFDELANEIGQALTRWGADLCEAHADFQAAIQHSESYLTARDLFDFIQNQDSPYSSQSTTKPITITPYRTSDGKTGLLITLGGTDFNDWSWDTDLFTALQTGMGVDNPYLDDVRRAILDYMREHQEMIGSEITFAGYSLGGMTAQQMAQDITSGKDTTLTGYDLHVAQVMTYGSPVMGSSLNKVKYAMYDASYDPVPLLSSHENSLLQPLGIAEAAPYALGSLLAADVLPWDIKLHHYIDPTGQYTGEIHNITDVGNTFLGDGTPLLQNHMEYQQSNQLNAPSTATTGIDPTTFGPSEYFKMQNTDNLYTRWAAKAPMPKLVFPRVPTRE